jgi:hypothetical protein
MAEPLDYGTGSMRVSREFLVSRLEKQLLAKVYDLVVPAASGCRHLPLSSAERVRSRRPTRTTTSQIKGVR